VTPDSKIYCETGGGWSHTAEYCFWMKVNQNAVDRMSSLKWLWSLTPLHSTFGSICRGWKKGHGQSECNPAPSSAPVGKNWSLVLDG